MVCATEGSQTKHPTLTNKWCFRGDGTAQFPECVQTHKYIYREMVGRHTFSWRAAQSYTPIYMCINICIHGLSAEEIASKGVRWTLGHGLPSVAADVRGVWVVYAPNHSQTPCPPPRVTSRQAACLSPGSIRFSDMVHVYKNVVCFL